MGPEGAELVEIEPQELKFVFELRKQSSCSVKLTNKSDEYVAFKVKTTSPKRYCVRPNAGIILPKTTLDFTVTLQAQRVFPDSMQCRDKFLVQSTVVPTGTRDDDLKSEIFSKEPGKHIQEIKLRVVFISPSHTSSLHPPNGASKHEQNSDVNGAPKQEQISETNVALKQERTSETCLPNEPSVPEESTAPMEVTSSRNSYVLQEMPSFKESNLVKETISSKETPEDEIQEFHGVENMQPSHASISVEQLNSRVKYLEAQLAEAKKINALLRDEKGTMAQASEKMYQELALLRVKHAPKVQVGFPFFFVLFIGLVGIVIGSLLHQ